MVGGVLWAGAALAVGCALLTLLNLALLPRARRASIHESDDRLVSVLIPARNEARNIGPAIDAVLTSTVSNLELIVLDDDSTDGTAAVVRERSNLDSRVRLITGAPLPSGWQGKVHACHQLAQAARGDVLVFVDADVRLAPQAIAMLRAKLADSGAALVSGIPHQLTCTWAEKLIVPLMHFVLYGYLPLVLMRRKTDPALGAACGQLVAVDAAAYHAAGGHAAIAGSVHDGIALARALRAHGAMTDLIDADTIAECRMYRSWAELLSGFAKNAHEGLGSPRGLVPWTLILLLGQTVPALALPFVATAPSLLLPAAIGAVAAYGARLALAWRFRQDALGVILHPIGVLLLVAIQWYALARRTLRLPLLWKERSVPFS